MTFHGVDAGPPSPEPMERAQSWQTDPRDLRVGEAAVKLEGFRTLCIDGPLAGRALYTPDGLRPVGHADVTMPDGTSIECERMEKPIA